MREEALSGTPLLLVEHDDAVAAAWETPRFDVAYVSAVSPDKSVSEDALLCFELADGSIVVCAIDGMGGMQGGRAAARISALAIRDQLGRFEKGMSRRATLVEGFERAHAKVREACPGGGATAVGAVISKADVQIVHAGDAEALIIGQRGKLKHRTVAHSPVGYAVHAGLLTEEEALVHPERHLVSSGIGIEAMTIQVGPKLSLARRDTVVLASDGLTDNVLESEIIGAMRRGDLMDRLSGLAALAQGRMLGAMHDPDGATFGKPDDLTVLAVRRRAGSRASR